MHDHLLDEELLLLSRLGVTGCTEALARRYYNAKEYHAKRAAPSACLQISNADLGGEFFSTYLKVVSSFRFGESLFKNYLETVLARDIYSLIDYNKENEVLYLGEPLPGTEGKLTFEEVMRSSHFNDPRTYLNYAEEALALGKAPAKLDRSVILVASLKCEGKTHKEVMKLTGMSIKQVKARYSIFCDFVNDILSRGGLRDKRLDLYGSASSN